MRLMTFTKRCFKEIIRDPLTIIFGIGFPIILLLLLSAIQANIPVEMFEIEKLTPGITIFGLSFITLFSATLIAKDRESALLQRLYTTPLSAIDFILGYLIPFIPIAIIQSSICYILGIILGLTPSINIIYSILMIIPISFLFIGLGLLFGSILNVKQVGGICGALLTNLSAWLSGIWFDISLVGKTFKTLANILPFVHAVELEKAIILREFSDILPHFFIILFYVTIIIILAILLFLKQMKKQ